MKFLVLAALVAAATATPTRFNPDSLMQNEGMIGGDIAGGINLVQDPVTVSMTNLQINNVHFFRDMCKYNLHVFSPFIASGQDHHHPRFLLYVLAQQCHLLRDPLQPL